MSSFKKKQMLSEMSQEFQRSLPTDNAVVATQIAESVADNYEIDDKILSAEYEETSAVIDAYLLALKVEGRTPKTISHYDYTIKKFFDFCGMPVSRVSVYHIRQYLDDCKSRGNSDITLEDKRSNLAAFFKWLHNEDIIEKNPMKNIGRIKFEKTVKDVYSKSDIYKLHNSCDIVRGDRCSEIRNRALLALLEATGCRISEICQINRDNIDFIDREIKVYGKGRKERIVYIDRLTTMLLQEYLNSRTDNLPALFIGKRSDRLTPGGIRKLLKSIAEKAGVDGVYPHKYRRTLATDLIKHGMPLEEVQKLLGHENINTTMQYVIVDQQAVKNSYNKYR